MKTIALIAAAGSLCAITAPAAAAEPTSLPIETHTAIAFDAATDSTVFYGDPPRWAPAYGRRDRDRGYRYDDDRDDDDDRRYRRDRRDRVYDRQGRYYEPRRVRRGDRIWRGRDGRYYCQRDNGTTGLVIGAGVGALLGRAIDTQGDRTVGTVLGGALGAVLGRELDRGDIRCR